MMQHGSIEDEFELFRAQSYGVESVLRHQRAASVRASTKEKVIPRQGDLERQSPEITPPRPRSAAERKASFKSSAHRRIHQQRIPEEVITSDDQTASGRCDQDGDGGEEVLRPLPDATEGCSVGADDVILAQRRADDDYDDVTDICRVYRMRSFYTKSGNIVNRGDSMRMRTHSSGGARRTLDVMKAVPSAGSSGYVVHAQASSKQCDDGLTDNSVPDNTASRDTSRDRLTVGHVFNSGSVRCQRLNSANESTEDIAASAYRVLVIGTHGVGKTKLIEQLMTSEYLANKESFAGMKFRNNINN